MNSAAVLHLAWKEYRAIRAFWLSIVALVVLAEATLLALSGPGTFRLHWIYHLALAAPAFFALGCAGTAFAMEREEGTFEFLSASPISAREVLASKLGVALVATIAQLAVLWAVAFLFSREQMPQADVLNGMLDDADAAELDQYGAATVPGPDLGHLAARARLGA
jgi:ABC-type transport system involved in cytochrome c biogenesis permease component